MPKGGSYTVAIIQIGNHGSYVVCGTGANTGFVQAVNAHIDTG